MHPDRFSLFSKRIRVDNRALKMRELWRNLEGDWTDIGLFYDTHIHVQAGKHRLASDGNGPSLPGRLF